MGDNMETENKIIEIINDLRPYLIIDGGDIEFVKYQNNVLYIKLIGNCVHCLMQDDTLKNGILKIIQEQLPEVKEIINVNL